MAGKLVSHLLTFVLFYFVLCVGYRLVTATKQALFPTTHYFSVPLASTLNNDGSMNIYGTKHSEN